MRIVVLALLLGGCGASGLAIANGAALGTSTGMLVCDWGQTRSAAANGWDGQWEGNPIMGRKPTTNAVDLYFLAAIGLNTLVWYVMPRRYRMIIPVVVTLTQLQPVSHNIETGLTPCGVR